MQTYSNNTTNKPLTIPDPNKSGTFKIVCIGKGISKWPIDKAISNITTS